VGRRIYQRNKIVFSFVTKKELTEQSAETNIKMEFEPTDTIQTVAQKIWDEVAKVKKSTTSKDEDITERLTRLPRWLTRLLMWGWKIFDYFHILPASAIKGDALYCTAYFANLGSIGIDAIQHTSSSGAPARSSWSSGRSRRRWWWARTASRRWRTSSPAPSASTSASPTAVTPRQDHHRPRRDDRRPRGAAEAARGRAAGPVQIRLSLHRERAGRRGGDADLGSIRCCRRPSNARRPINCEAACRSSWTTVAG
jgi:hypothetical protein